MSPDPRILTLIRARQLVESYLPTLNTASALCPCCGLTKYENFSDVQSHSVMQSIVNKLNREIGSLEDKSRQG